MEKDPQRNLQAALDGHSLCNAMRVRRRRVRRYDRRADLRHELHRHSLSGDSPDADSNRRTRTAPLAPSQIRSRIELSFGSQTRSRVKRETSPSPMRIRGIRQSNDSPSEWNGYCGNDNDTDGNNNVFGQEWTRGAYTNHVHTVRFQAGTTGRISRSAVVTARAAPPPRPFCVCGLFDECAILCGRCGIVLCAIVLSYHYDRRPTG